MEVAVLINWPGEPSQDAGAKRDERRGMGVDAKIGWNRIAFAVSLLIIAVASVTLFRLLRDVDLERPRRAGEERRRAPSCSPGSWSRPAMSR
jgi:hypothetical protein